MREIKFRVFTWDTRYPNYEHKNYMLDVLSINFETNKIMIPYKIDECREVNIKEENLTLMQYTGLKDKNGKEIYEGDFVKVHDNGHDFLTEVKWDKAGFVIFLESKWFVSMIYNSIERIEIIGNIYENPNLLLDI